MNGASSSTANPSGIAGICPEGWHLPSDAEWKVLANYLGSNDGKKMKSTSGWSGNLDGDNSSGFTALPGGSRLDDGNFTGLGLNNAFWSFTEYGSLSSWGRGLLHNDNNMQRYYGNQSLGLSVRCLMNQTANLPTVTTGDITGITETSATGGGNVTSDGGASVTARGVCWNTTGTPTISNNKTTDRSGTGAFASSLTGLTALTTYYVRAYATNSNGTAYGNQVSFTTSPVPIPNAPTNLSATVVSRSLINLAWNDNSNNETGFKIERSLNNSTWAEIATVVSNVTTYQNTDLTASTTYYYRARAYNSAGNSTYSLTASATTLSIVSSIVLSGPTSASGPFNLTWTYTWPQLETGDDHYELEWSYSSSSGYQLMTSFPNGVRTSPYTIVMTPEAVDIGKTAYLRVRAKAAGAYTAYSNVVGVSIPYLNLTINPSVDNLVMKQSNDLNKEKTVYRSTDFYSLETADKKPELYIEIR
jgi:uncharacterized protein (TIGR02145 family)